ncbi:hypothetical protein JOQ06_006673, partial [Pogonophryne albipinna]
VQGFLCSAPSQRRPIKAIRQRCGSCAALRARGEQSFSPAPSSSISSAVPQNGSIHRLSPLPHARPPTLGISTVEKEPLHSVYSESLENYRAGATGTASVSPDCLPWSYMEKPNLYTPDS